MPSWTRNGLAAMLMIAGAIAPALAGPRATTGAGVVEGTAERGVAVYRGIPYAAPPTGANRWRAPQPLAAWPGVRSAARFGHSCWQAVSPQGFGPWTHEFVVAGDVAEDCLYLNVWTPARRATPRPVLAWIHGGGFNSGSGAIPIYDGRVLAAQGIVVVTINYRVGVFGFLSHPELTAEAGAGIAGNYGLQDMVAALRWVRANIAAFGGDPARVTIAGQSAGAMAVHELVAAPAASGLFARAIAESGLPRVLPPRADAEAQGVAFAREKGAASLAALRTQPAEALQPSRGANAVRFGPVADGVLLPSRDARPVSEVPMLVGFNADEGSALGQDYGSPDPARLRALIAGSFGQDAAGVASHYPADSEAARRAANRQVRRDRGAIALFAWAGRREGAARVHLYCFAHVSPGPEAARWGAFHSSEIPYVFGSQEAAPERHWEASDRTLSLMMQRYWLAFVTSGDPNGPGRPRWPAFHASEPQWLRIDNDAVVAPLLPPPLLGLARAGVARGQRFDIF